MWYFGGRLGEYKYYDMDAVIASALDMCEIKRSLRRLYMCGIVGFTGEHAGSTNSVGWSVKTGVPWI